MRSAVDEAWSLMRPEERAQSSKSLLAIRVLEAAAGGERDPAKLRAQALLHIVSSKL
jgi:hypothetical protein